MTKKMINWLRHNDGSVHSNISDTYIYFAIRNKWDENIQMNVTTCKNNNCKVLINKTVNIVL